MTNTDTKTIHEFLAENPNVDVSRAWERFWRILTAVKDRITARFEVTRHASCAGREYYTSPNGEWEGSLNTFTSSEVDWLVHSWLGSRKNSILDMNATAFLGQQTRVPHLVVVFGTIPRVFFYCDYVPRADIRVDEAYLERYYEPVNKDYLALRGDSRFTWSVSHGTYMRAMLSPVCSSFTADMTDDVIDTLEAYVNRFVHRWLGWLDEAEPVPENERAALRAYDFKVRELGYRRDPMNSLAETVFGKDNVASMVEMRMGREQMNASLRAR
jgi:hypothetical protein